MTKTNDAPAPAPSGSGVRDDWRAVLTEMVAAMNKYGSDHGDGDIPSHHRALMWRAEQLLASDASPRGEAVAYQQFKNGKWVECSYFVAFGFENTIAEGCRALYARPAPATVESAPELEHERWRAGAFMQQQRDRFIDRYDAVRGAAQAMLDAYDRWSFDDEPARLRAALAPATEGKP